MDIGNFSIDVKTVLSLENDYICKKMNNNLKLISTRKQKKGTSLLQCTGFGNSFHIPNLFSPLAIFYLLCLCNDINLNPGPDIASQDSPPQILNENFSLYFANVANIHTDKKLPAFNLHFYDAEYDFICINETWFNDRIQDSEILNNNYDIYRNDRNNGKLYNKYKAGGVMIAVNNNKEKDIKKKNIISKPRNEFNKGESVWIEVELVNKRKLFIGCVYLPPDNTNSTFSRNEQLEQLDESLHLVRSVMKDNDELILCGDFNVPNITWPRSFDANEKQKITPTLRSLYTSDDTDFLEITFKHGLSQHVCFKTRKENTLDLVFTTNPDNYDINVHPIDTAVKSDHISIHCDINMKSPLYQQKPVRHSFFKWWKADIPKLKNKLNECAWHLLLNYDVNTACNMFYEMLEAAIKACVPYGESQCIKFPNWYDDEIKKCLKLKQKANVKYLKSKNEKDFEKFKEIRKKFKQMQKIKYKKHVKKIEDDIKNNPKKFWNFVSNAKKKFGNSN
jgi:exonuclease III